MANSMRKAIASRMSLSKQTIPHYYLTMRADVSEMMRRRQAWNANRGEEDRISVNDLIVKAAALALGRHPGFNGFYVDDEFRAEERINIGIAIALPDGLLAPAILDCQSASLNEIARRSRDLARRARQNKLRAGEYTDATFTITNLGMYDVDSFSAIIVPPQVAILAVGTVREVPALRNGELVSVQELSLTLSADHRVTDGVEGARFLGDVVACLQDPEVLYTDQPS